MVKEKKKQHSWFLKMACSVSRLLFIFYRSISKLRYSNHILLKGNADFCANDVTSFSSRVTNGDVATIVISGKQKVVDVGFLKISYALRLCLEVSP